MSKKTNGIQVGNFIVTRDNGSEHDWISINATPDVKFMEEFFKSYSDLTERLRGLQQPVSPEDDAKILEEERNMNSIKEGIKEEHKNEGTD